MNEVPRSPQHSSPLEIGKDPIVTIPVCSKRPEGRVSHILTDVNALKQWQSNLKKLRQQDACL